MNCPNCGSVLSCGCQRRVASDGKQCCSSCVTRYNISISTQPVSQPGVAEAQVLTPLQQINLKR